MLRRRKEEILPELPAKTRQWIPVTPDLQNASVLEHLQTYRTLMDDLAGYVIADPADRIRAEGCMEHARIEIALAKLADGQIAESIVDIMAQRGSCLVFGVHRLVIDLIRSQLATRGVTSVHVDGRVSGQGRVAAVNAFVAGEAQVYVGSIDAGGESVTLTRADTVVVLELHWVPAALLQAEDRGHRLGQCSPAYRVIYYYAEPEVGPVDAIMADVLRQNSSSRTASSARAQASRAPRVIWI